MQDTLDPNEREHEQRAIAEVREAEALAKKTGQDYEQFRKHWQEMDRQKKRTGVEPEHYQSAKSLVMECWQKHEDASRALARARNRLNVIQGRSESAIPVYTKPPEEPADEEPFVPTEAMRFAQWLVKTGRLNENDPSLDPPVLPVPAIAAPVEEEPELTMVQKRERFARWLVEQGRLSEGEA